MSDPIATSDIYLGDPGSGRRAFSKGQTVPAHLVEANGWQDYVSTTSSKTGQQAVADVTGQEPATGKKG